MVSISVSEDNQGLRFGFLLGGFRFKLCEGRRVELEGYRALCVRPPIGTKKKWFQ